jgi:hypothetical protein
LHNATLALWSDARTCAITTTAPATERKKFWTCSAKRSKIYRQKKLGREFAIGSASSPGPLGAAIAGKSLSRPRFRAGIDRGACGGERFDFAFAQSGLA